MGFLFSKSESEKSAPAMEQVSSGLVNEKKPKNRVLVVGGSYAGLSAIVNLLILAHGGAHAPSIVPFPEVDGSALNTDIEITLVEEKDGWCKFLSLERCLANSS